MKILFCLNKDIFSNIALNYLKDILENHKCYITLSEGVGKPNSALNEVKLLEHSLPYQSLFPVIDNLNLNSKFYSFDRLANKYLTPIIDLEGNINSKENQNYIANLELDLIVSIRYGQIFKDNIIDLPKHGILNLHSGKLPDYRGIMASFQALLHDEKKLGTTLHYITDKNIDTGDIIDIAYINNDKQKSYFWHLDQLYIVGCSMLLKNINEIALGSIPKGNSQSGKGKYFSVPTNAEIAKFHKKGYVFYSTEDYKEIIKKFIAND